MRPSLQLKYLCIAHPEFPIRFWQNLGAEPNAQIHNATVECVTPGYWTEEVELNASFRALGDPCAPPTVADWIPAAKALLRIQRRHARRAQTDYEPLLPGDQTSRVGDVLLDAAEVVLVGHPSPLRQPPSDYRGPLRFRE